MNMTWLETDGTGQDDNLHCHIQAAFPPNKLLTARAPLKAHRSNDDDRREKFDSPSASRVIPLHYSSALWQRQRQRRL
jgi:hypothetical protein